MYPGAVRRPQKTAKGQGANQRTLDMGEASRMLWLGGERDGREVGTRGIKCVTRGWERSLLFALACVKLSVLLPLSCVRQLATNGLLLSFISC